MESGKPAEEEDHPLMEVMIHQLIETIEFVLGTISNTASYLRLWALSLAHSQLATVFFSNTLEVGLAIPGIAGRFFALWIGYLIFGTLTVGILMLMDTMECFLHTLRLHWVEFQSKFYGGQGYAFVPFTLNDNLPQHSAKSHKRQKASSAKKLE